MKDHYTYFEVYEATKKAEEKQRQMQREIILASIDGYIKAIAKFTKCKQDARTMHDMAAGQLYLAKALDLITEEEHETLQKQITHAYGEAVYDLYA